MDRLLPLLRTRFNELVIQRSFLVLIVLIFGFSIQVEGCKKNSDCSGYGYCNPSKTCICHFGHIGKDCSEADSQTRKGTVITLQVIYGLIYAIMTIISSVGVYHTLKRTSSTVIFISNVQKIIFVTSFLSNLMVCIHASVDPFESWNGGVVPLFANNLLLTQVFPAQIFSYSVLLFHWIELVNISMDALKKENMYKKININYRGKDITVEEMVERVTMLNKLKIPFAVFVCLVTVLLVGCQIVYGVKLRQFYMNRILYSTVIICWVGLGVGFLFYGRRLVAIMPDQLTKRAKKLTFRLTVISCVAAGSMILLVGVLSVVQTSSPDADLASWTVAVTLLAAINFVIVSVFVHWSQKFPFVTFNTLSTRSGKSGTYNSGSHNSPQQVSEANIGLGNEVQYSNTNEGTEEASLELAE